MPNSVAAVTCIIGQQQGNLCRVDTISLHCLAWECARMRVVNKKNTGPRCLFGSVLPSQSQPDVDVAVISATDQ